MARIALFIAAAVALASCAVLSHGASIRSVAREAVSATLNTSAAGLSIVVQAKYPLKNLEGGSVLTLRGDGLGLNWNSGVQMTMDTDSDLATITLPYTQADVGSTLAMKVLVNDKDWMIGANAQVVLPPTACKTTIFPFFYSQTGTFTVSDPLYSPQLDNYRPLVVYTPPSYQENTYKTYDKVLLMHDGQNLFNASTSFIGIAWMCQTTVDELVNEGAMDEIVIVGVYNTANRTAEYTYSVDPTVGDGGKGDLYLDFLEQTAMPYAATLYRIQPPNPATGYRWGILGSSLGGLISCYAAWERPATYDKAGCMSSSFWWNSEDFNNTILTQPKSPMPRISVYLDSGNAGPDDDDVTQTITVRGHFEELGYTLNSTLFYYLDNGGQHNEKYWGARFHEPMTYLYPPSNLPTHVQ